jgi:pentatricopeptide repeat protein
MLAHHLLLSHGLQEHPSVGSHLLQMYGKCGAPRESVSIFASMSFRNVFAFNYMMGLQGVVEGGSSIMPQAEDLFDHMLQQSVLPNRVTFVSLLSNVSTHAHAHAPAHGSTTSAHGSTTSAHGSTTSAHGSTTSAHGSTTSAHGSTTFKHGSTTFKHGSTTSAHGSTAFKHGSTTSAHGSSTPARIHARIACCDFRDDVVVGTALVTMYGKAQMLDEAQRAFDSLPERNPVSWTALIALYVHRERHDVVLHLFQQMSIEGTLPDRVTYVNVLSSISSARMLGCGMILHALVHWSGLGSDLMVANALISMYSQCGSFDDARTLLLTIPRRDVISWTAVIVVFMEQGQGSEALSLFGQMQNEGIMPDLVCFMAILTACSKNGTLAEGNLIYWCLMDTSYVSDMNVSAALVNMYGKCGSPDDAKRVFDRVSTRDVFLWNTMIAVYSQVDLRQALHLFEVMQRQNKATADVVTFVSMLDACAGKAALVDGKIVHAIASSNGFEKDIIICNAAINLYGKCGSLKDAQKTFDMMDQRNVISWTTVIAVYAQNGQGKVALQLFSRMQKEGPTPDEVTFLGLLVACRNAGLVVEGCQFFHSMTRSYHLSPGVDHFACMIDLLARSGRMDAAEELFDRIPLQPTVEALTALVACGHQSHMLKKQECSLDHQSGFEMDPCCAEIKKRVTVKQ